MFSTSQWYGIRVQPEGLGLDFSWDTEMVYSILPYIIPFYEKLRSQS